MEAICWRYFQCCQAKEEFNQIMEMKLSRDQVHYRNWNWPSTTSVRCFGWNNRKKTHEILTCVYLKSTKTLDYLVFKSVNAFSLKITVVKPLANRVKGYCTIDAAFHLENEIITNFKQSLSFTVAEKNFSNYHASSSVIRRLLNS